MLLGATCISLELGTSDPSSLGEWLCRHLSSVGRHALWDTLAKMAGVARGGAGAERMHPCTVMAACTEQLHHPPEPLPEIPIKQSAHGLSGRVCPLQPKLLPPLPLVKEESFPLLLNLIQSCSIGSNNTGQADPGQGLTWEAW